MTRGIGKRVRDLEALHGREPCGECGDGGGPTPLEVIWTDPREHSEPKWCGECGRPTEIVVTWDGLQGPLGDSPRTRRRTS
jgi:hypothetical protein